MYDVFISYSHKDQEWVSGLVTHLRRRRKLDGIGNLQVFLDSDSIGVGENWISAIEHALGTSRYIVPVFSESYFASKASGWELLQKLITDLDGNERAILPCLLKDCNIPPRVRHLQYLDFRNAYDQSSQEFSGQFERLVETIKGRNPTSKRLSRKVNKGDSILPDFPYFVYISDSKLEMLEAWISLPSRTTDSPLRPGRARLESIREVLAQLEASEQIGQLGDDRPFFVADLPMSWGIVDWGVCDADVKVAFFLSIQTNPLILMGGSAHHVLGTQARKYEFPGGSFGYSGSHLPGIMRAIRFSYGSDWSQSIGGPLDWLFSVQLCRQGLPLTRGDEVLPPFSFPEQRVTFVARVLKKIKRPEESELAEQLSWFSERMGKSNLLMYKDLPKADVLVCTPLYVALSDRL